MHSLSLPKISHINIIIVISLIAILCLVYFKNNNFELFGTSDNPEINTMTTIPSTPSPLLNNDVIQNIALVNFINRFITNKNQQNVYVSTLADRQKNINNLSTQVVKLINPTV
jgi:hypothetical protein